jgi:hypothetical protein
MPPEPFDPVAWARGCGLEPAEPRRVEEPDVDLVGEVAIDRNSLTARVPARMAGVAVESRLRDAGLTLGLFPERYEVASVADLAAGDDPGAGASGPGFASLVLERGPDTLLLALRARPDAQAGRAYLMPDMATGIEGLRAVAQAATLPELALLADRPAADLLLRVAQDPDGALGSLRPASALLILIAAGRHGEAAARVEAAAQALGTDHDDLGQNVARAWAQSRYDLPSHMRRLAAAGYRLDTAFAWQTWSALPEAYAEATAQPGYAGCEILGAGPHGARLVLRSLSGQREGGDAERHENRAEHSHAGHGLTEERGGETGGDHDARLADGRDGPG